MKLLQHLRLLIQVMLMGLMLDLVFCFLVVKLIAKKYQHPMWNYRAYKLIYPSNLIYINFKNMISIVLV